MGRRARSRAERADYNQTDWLQLGCRYLKHRYGGIHLPRKVARKRLTATMGHLFAKGLPPRYVGQVLAELNGALKGGLRPAQIDKIATASSRWWKRDHRRLGQTSGELGPIVAAIQTYPWRGQVGGSCHRLLVILAEQAKINGSLTVELSHRQLQEYTGLSVGAVQAAKAALTQAGFLQWERPKNPSLAGAFTLRLPRKPPLTEDETRGCPMGRGTTSLVDLLPTASKGLDLFVRRIGVGPYGYKIIQALTAGLAHTSQTDLAKQLGLRLGTLTTILKRLETLGIAAAEETSTGKVWRLAGAIPRRGSWMERKRVIFKIERAVWHQRLRELPRRVLVPTPDVGWNVLDHYDLPAYVLGLLNRLLIPRPKGRLALVPVG